MSHQTGIQADDELTKFLTKIKNGKIRAFKVIIKNEQLCLAQQEQVKSTWENDYDKYVLSFIEDDQPCYILYRLDSKTDLGYQWLFISWSPDTSVIRQKMLYASTKATLKQLFGMSQIKEEIHGTVKSEISISGYYKYKKNAVEPAPLTSREEELQEIKKTEVHTDYNVNSKQQTLSGVNFPLSLPCENSIKDMIRGSYNYVQFKIDLEEEKIHLVCAENINLDKLPSKVPSETARYHLYRFNHTHEGDYMESIVFIYSMPGYNCPIKERMLYSSCKNTLIDKIESFGLEIAKKLEIDSGSELTENYLYEEIHPTKCLHRPKFEKPKGPPNRGPKRMTKAQK